MHINDIFAKHPTTFSFEFFPPKSDEAAEKLFNAISELEPLRPSFVSVTYGAGGGTRTRTHELVMRIKRETSLLPVPHLTCVCHTEAEIHDILERYAQAEIPNILALGGDPPKDRPSHIRERDSFPYAEDLVRYIRNFKDTYAGRCMSDPRGFGVGVAGFPEGHPGTPNRLKEMDYLKRKVDAGADYICTQLFFDNRDFYDYRERCELAGIKVPIIAGVMPITSAKGMERMAELALGARYPAPLVRSIERCNGDPAAVRRVGVHWATEQCRDMLDNNVRGIHFYTLNMSTATREIYANLGVKDSLALA
ncbi:MAG: methylenetetrahydrofolate reductase [NAD(P)H] [Phycisphaeraceae bacterium]|nr:MAG: methylenetetrahydrofolate reductase [NAD(P)H] [Phycisphaeraceae bacterium]